MRWRQPSTDFPGQSPRASSQAPSGESHRRLALAGTPGTGGIPAAPDVCTARAFWTLVSRTLLIFASERAASVVGCEDEGPLGGDAGGQLHQLPGHRAPGQAAVPQLHVPPVDHRLRRVGHPGGPPGHAEEELGGEPQVRLARRRRGCLGVRHRRPGHRRSVFRLRLVARPRRRAKAAAAVAQAPPRSVPAAPPPDRHRFRRAAPGPGPGLQLRQERRPRRSVVPVARGDFGGRLRRPRPPPRRVPLEGPSGPVVPARRFARRFRAGRPAGAPSVTPLGEMRMASSTSSADEARRAAPASWASPTVPAVPSVTRARPGERPQDAGHGEGDGGCPAGTRKTTRVLPAGKMGPLCLGCGARRCVPTYSITCCLGKARAMCPGWPAVTGRSS